jgi:hypothetical protein
LSGHEFAENIYKKSAELRRLAKYSQNGRPNGQWHPQNRIEAAVGIGRILKEFYLRLRAAGKKPLVAMTACMRKLVILMNRLLKNHEFQLASLHRCFTDAMG